MALIVSGQVSARPIRVVLVDPNANTPPYDRALAAALGRAGCNVELATSPFLYEPLPPPQGFRVEHSFFRMLDSPALRHVEPADRPRFRRLLKAVAYPLDWTILLARLGARPPDLIHVQWAIAPRMERLCWAALRRAGVPIVYTVHNLLPHGATDADIGRYGRLYRAADALIVHGNGTARSLTSMFGVNADRVTRVPHGPLLEEEPEITSSEARARVGLPQGAPVVLFAGLIEPYKGLGDLIVAFSQIATRMPEARLVVAGRANESFEPYQRMLHGLGLAEKTRLDLRFLPRAVLAAYLCAADVVALPYRQATTSGSLMTAWRFGRAVVTTTVGNLEEHIVEAENGLLVPPSDPSALATALERVLRDPSLSRRLGEAGRQRSLTELSWNEAARRTIEVYWRVSDSQ